MDCILTNWKEFDFYYKINNYNGLNLMAASTVLNNYYQITRSYYLSDEDTKKEIKFFSDSI